MPDLLTHVSTAYFFAKPRSNKRFTSLFFLGTILPDVLTRPMYYVFPKTYWFVYPLHTPLTVMLVCALGSFFFAEQIRTQVFWNLSAGAGLHFFMDFFQIRLIGTYAWFFPFSDHDVGLGLFWQDDSIYVLPFLLLGVLVFEIFTWLGRTRF